MIERNHQENVLNCYSWWGYKYHLSYFKSIEWTNKNKSFPSSNTNIHKIEYVNDGWEITQENLIVH